MPANRRQLFQYKGDKCANCGLRVQEMIERHGDFTRIFEFNHIDPSIKHKDYDNLIRRVISTEQLDEVDKCVLLCRNCHGILHQQSLTATLSVHVAAGDRQIEQTFRGQLIEDRIENTMSFFTDAEVLLHPYRVFIGEQPPQIRFGQELRNGELLPLIRDLANIQALRITSWQGALMLEMHATEDPDLQWKQDISFPVLSYELTQEKNDATYIWIRKGVALTRNGEVIRNGLLTCHGRFTT